eukprot:3512523-Pyramimonas_sp.AAC.1
MPQQPRATHRLRTCAATTMCNTAPAHTTVLACTAAPVHATAPVYTAASTCNAALAHTTVPARIGQVEGACT